MSEQNVERVRAAISALNSSGWDPAEVVPFFAPECVHHPFPEWPGPPSYEGRDGLRTLIEEWTENFDALVWDIERLIDAGDVVVALVHQRGRSKAHAVPVATTIGAVFADFRDEGIAQARYFLSWDAAVEAAGIP